MASLIYNVFKANLMNKVVDLEADNIYVTLVDATKVAAFNAADTDYSTTNELATGGGYTRGADATNLLAIKAGTAGATTKWDATDHAWSAATFTAYGAVIYDATVGATNNLICAIDFGGAKTVSAGTFTIVWDAAGIITLT
jgi:hypothetical protein